MSAEGAHSYFESSSAGSVSLSNRPNMAGIMRLKTSSAESGSQRTSLMLLSFRGVEIALEVSGLAARWCHKSRAVRVAKRRLAIMRGSPMVRA
jgi:hypothetical protein